MINVRGSHVKPKMIFDKIALMLLLMEISLCDVKVFAFQLVIKNKNWGEKLGTKTKIKITEIKMSSFETSNLSSSEYSAVNPQIIELYSAVLNYSALGS